MWILGCFECLFSNIFWECLWKMFFFFLLNDLILGPEKIFETSSSILRLDLVSYFFCEISLWIFKEDCLFLIVSKLIPKNGSRYSFGWMSDRKSWNCFWNFVVYFKTFLDLVIFEFLCVFSRLVSGIYIRLMSRAIRL